MEVNRHGFGGLAEIIARLKGPGIGLHHRRVLGKLVPNPAQRGVHGSVIEPIDQSQREEILAAVGLAGAELHVGDRLAVQRVDRNSKDAKSFERIVI